MFIGLGDTGIDYNFLNNKWTQDKGFILLIKCDQEFVTFYNNKFKVYQVYNLEVFITDNYNKTCPFKFRFYNYKNISIYCLIFNIINILYNSFLIKFYTKNKIISINILIIIESEFKRICLVTIIYNKNLKIINLIDFKFIIIKDYKFLITLN